MTRTDVAQTLGDLIKLNLIEAVVAQGQPTRYRLKGEWLPEEEDLPTRRIPVTRVPAIEGAAAVEITA